MRALDARGAPGLRQPTSTRSRSRHRLHGDVRGRRGRATAAGVGSTLNCTAAGTTRPTTFRWSATVTWPNMGKIKPVQRATSLVSPRASDVSNGRGSLVVTRARTRPARRAGAAVTVSAHGDAAVTDSRRLRDLPTTSTAGTTTVAWSKLRLRSTPDGSADRHGRDVSITNNTIASITPTLDLAAKITTTFKNENGGVPASATGQRRAGRHGHDAAGPSSRTSGSPAGDHGPRHQGRAGVTHSNLFPTTSGYGLSTPAAARATTRRSTSQDFNTKYPEALQDAVARRHGGRDGLPRTA